MSSGGSLFFDEERFPNRMKHAILGGYVPGALALLIQKFRRDAVYGDLFAGEAVYRDGRPGSPRIIAERARARLARGEQHLIRCFNVEADPATYQRLVENTKDIPSDVVTNRPGKWEDHIAELLALMHDKPAILFLDPFGSRGMELDKLVRILGGIGSDAWEMILRFDIDGLRRGNIAPARELERAGIAHGYYDLPTKVFGTHKWKHLLEDYDLPESRYDEFLELYMTQLITAGGKPFHQRFVAPVPIPTRLGGTADYYLIFVTRSGKALSMISEAVQTAMEKAWREQEAIEAAKPKQIALDLPGVVIETPSYDDRMVEISASLKSAVGEYIGKLPWAISFPTLYQEMAQRFFALFREKHLRAVVKALRAEGVLVTNRNAIDDRTMISRAPVTASQSA